MSNDITVIEAYGTPTDIGRAIGRAVGDSVHAAVVTQDEFVQTASAFRGSAYVTALRDAAQQAYPQYVEELEAMAAAVDIDPETLFIWNCRGDLRLPPDVAADRLALLVEGCTTVMSPGNFADGKPAIISHNEDGDGAFMGHRYWLQARPNDAPAFDSYLYPGMLPGHSVAVTHAGLVQTINNIRPDDLKPGLPRHFVCRAVLAETSIPGVIEHLRRDDRASGFHHAIGMLGEETPLSVEAPATKTVIDFVTKPRGHANHLLDDAFDGLDQVVTSSSMYRQQTVDDFVAADDADTRPATDVLFQRSEDGGESVYRRPGDGGDDYGCTLATAVFEIGEDRINWRVHNDRDGSAAISGTVNGGN